MSTTHLTAGFLPLLDSVLLVLAREKGFAEAEGLDLTLVRETSWANIRDRAALGHFDVAQMLAPMPLAASLNLTPLATEMIAPVVCGLGNNAITVSTELWTAMADHGAPQDLAAGPSGAALARVVASSQRKLRFGVVHQTSSHNYELRYWLAASGIRPDRDIEIVVLPPSLLPDALGGGGLDGYCVGEPWNSIGVASKGAHMVTTKAAIWQSSPDKVIGMRASWAEQNPELVASIIRAIYHTGQWCADPAVSLISAPVKPSTCPTFSLPTPALPTFHGRAMRCGIIRRWCVGARWPMAPAMRRSLQPVSDPTSIARRWRRWARMCRSWIARPTARMPLPTRSRARPVRWLWEQTDFSTVRASTRQRLNATSPIKPQTDLIRIRHIPRLIKNCSKWRCFEPHRAF